MSANQSDVKNLEVLSFNYLNNRSAESAKKATELLVEMSEYVHDIKKVRLAYIRHKFFLYRMRSTPDDSELDKIERLVLKLVKANKPAEVAKTKKLAERLKRFSEPRVVSKLTREEYKANHQHKVAAKGATSIGVSLTHMFLIEPALGPLGNKVAKLVSGLTTVEEAQEVVDNEIGRLKAKYEGRTPPPRAYFPSLLGTTIPTVIKTTKQEYQDNYKDKIAAGEVSVIKDSDSAYWVLTPAIAAINFAINKDTRSYMTADQVQQLINNHWNDFQAKIKEYSDYRQFQDCSS